MSKAHIQWLSGCVRVFDNGKDYGDSYDWCATVRILDDTTIELLGVKTAPTKEQIVAISKLFYPLGFINVQWDRKKGDKERTVKLKIRDYQNANILPNADVQ